MKTVSFALIAVLGSVAVACASQHADDGVATSDSHDTVGVAPAADSDAGAGVTCDSTTTQSDCVTCCAQMHPAGMKTYQAAVTACICSADVCSAECSATHCAQQAPSADCASCANDHVQGACGIPVTTACESDPDCVAFQGCLASASCAAKPAQ